MTNQPTNKVLTILDAYLVGVIGGAYIVGIWAMVGLLYPLFQ